MSSKLGELASGAQQVSDGAAQVAAGNRQLAAQADQASGGRAADRHGRAGLHSRTF
ncbi:hypothetical protein ACRAWC_20490 [Leifsonia sp. L25]|uniref:hypothetical protein n=1 Tax=Leifsonia sp. L25 TaxID=3423957 RepID=UPI003D6896E6